MSSTLGSYLLSDITAATSCLFFPWRDFPFHLITSSPWNRIARNLKLNEDIFRVDTNLAWGDLQCQLSSPFSPSRWSLLPYRCPRVCHLRLSCPTWPCWNRTRVRYPSWVSSDVLNVHHLVTFATSGDANRKVDSYNWKRCFLSTATVFMPHVTWINFENCRSKLNRIRSSLRVLGFQNFFYRISTQSTVSELNFCHFWIITNRRW